MTKFYLIYKQVGTESPTVQCYARTEYEAHRECTLRAREYCPDYTEDRPLWCGEEPTKVGPTLMYTYPGPNNSSIEVRKAVEYNPWFGKRSVTFETNVPDVRFYYEPIQRSSCMDREDLPTGAPKDVVKGAEPKRVKRSGVSAHDRLLNEIEQRGKAGTATPPTPPPMPSRL